MTKKERDLVKTFPYLVGKKFKIYLNDKDWWAVAKITSYSHSDTVLELSEVQYRNKPEISERDHVQARAIKKLIPVNPDPPTKQKRKTWFHFKKS